MITNSSIDGRQLLLLLDRRTIIIITDFSKSLHLFTSVGNEKMLGSFF